MLWDGCSGIRISRYYYIVLDNFEIIMSPKLFPTAYLLEDIQIYVHLKAGCPTKELMFFYGY